MYTDSAIGACDAPPDFRRLCLGRAEVDSERNHLFCGAHLQANSVIASTRFTILGGVMGRCGNRDKGLGRLSNLSVHFKCWGGCARQSGSSFPKPGFAAWQSVEGLRQSPSPDPATVMASPKRGPFVQ